jgi:mannosyltransferase OCH1-like enzyme
VVKILHQIWIGDNLPEYALSNQETFKNTHLDWVPVIWREREIKILLRDSPLFETFMACSNSKIAQADLARLYIVYYFGGLYADLDVTFFRNIEPLLAKKHTVFFREAQTGMVTNSIFYSCPNAACFNNTLSKLVQVPNITNSADVLQFAGPEFLTKVIENASDVDIKSHIYFEYSSKKEHSFQYGYHKYAGSWL